MTEDDLEFKQKLEGLLQKFTKTELAKQFGISRQAFYKWLRKYQIDQNTLRVGTNKTIPINKRNDIADQLLNK